jgi:hypothetical protein
MSGRVYARAGKMRVSPFRDSDNDTVRATLQRVIYPRSFLSRLRTNPKAEFVSAECVIRNRAESIPLRFEDLVAFHFPIGTVGVTLRFKPRYSFGDSLLSIKTNLITDDIEDIEIVGKREAVVDLLEWLHVPLSEFRLK